MASGLSDGPCSEADLVRLAQNAGPKSSWALERLLEAYNPLITSAVVRLVRRTDLHKDAYQEGAEAFIKAVRRFDPTGPTPLSSYAKEWVHGAVRRFRRKEYRFARTHVSIPSPSDEEGEGVKDFARWGYEDIGLELVELAPMARETRKFVGTWSHRERWILSEVFYAGRSQADVARQMGVGKMQVTRLLQSVYKEGRAHLVVFISEDSAA